MLLLGAGVSAAPPSRLPLAGELVNGYWAALVADPDLERHAEQLPGNPVPALGTPELIYNATAEYAADVVPGLFRTALASDRPNVNHRAAAKLLELGLIERIVTTNFDTLIERCPGMEGVTVHVEDEGPGGPGTIWKLHGDIAQRVAIASNDVALIGFSPIPTLLAKAIAGREVIVAGYSGNDFHIVRAFLDGRPERTWWIVLPGDRPEAVTALSASELDVVVVEGDLAAATDGNPLVELLGAARFTEPEASRPTSPGDGLEGRLGRVIAPLDKLQKAMMLHSLLRRAGIETDRDYQLRLSAFIHNSMVDQQMFPDYFRSGPHDVVNLYEAQLQPRLVVRPTILRRHGLDVDPTDAFADAKVNHEAVAKTFGPIDEADILLETGLEKAYQGRLERAGPILDAAFQRSESIDHRALRMRSAEAVAWVAARLGDGETAERAHAVFSDDVVRLADDLDAVRTADDLDAAGGLLRDLGDVEAPSHLSKTLAVDRRFRRHLRLLQLAARLRYVGKAELALEVLDLWPTGTTQDSIYARALEGSHRLERGRCRFFEGEVAAGIQEMEAAGRELEVLKDWDYEFVRSYNRLMIEHYARAGRIVDAIKAHLHTETIPMKHYQRGDDELTDS